MGSCFDLSLEKLGLATPIYLVSSTWLSGFKWLLMKYCSTDGQVILSPRIVT